MLRLRIKILILFHIKLIHFFLSLSLSLTLLRSFENYELLRFFRSFALKLDSVWIGLNDFCLLKNEYISKQKNSPEINLIYKHFRHKLWTDSIKCDIYLFNWLLKTFQVKRLSSRLGEILLQQRILFRVFQTFLEQLNIPIMSNFTSVLFKKSHFHCCFFRLVCVRMCFSLSLCVYKRIISSSNILDMLTCGFGNSVQILVFALSHNMSCPI